MQMEVMFAEFAAVIARCDLDDTRAACRVETGTHSPLDGVAIESVSDDLEH